MDKWIGVYLVLLGIATIVCAFGPMFMEDKQRYMILSNGECFIIEAKGLNVTMPGLTDPDARIFPIDRTTVCRDTCK